MTHATLSSSSCRSPVTPLARAPTRSAPTFETIARRSRSGGAIAVGNIAGSNIFNILGILGVSSLIVPIAVSPAALWFDTLVMIAVALAGLAIFRSAASISRWEGVAHRRPVDRRRVMRRGNG